MPNRVTKTENFVQLNFHIPKHTRDRLNAICKRLKKREGKSRTFIINSLIDKFIEENHHVIEQ